MLYVDGRGFEIFGYFVNWYGVIIAFGMFLGVLLAIKLAKKQGLKADNIIDLALICIPCAIIGARLYYVIFYEHNYTFWEIFKIWEGGLAIYGGIIGGAIGVIIYCAVKKINFFKVADCIVPSLILGQAIGRWGNFTNHEAYGCLITDPNLQFFPFGVLIESNNYTPLARQAVIDAFGSLQSEAWFMATFFYESMWNFMVLGLLLFIFYKNNVRGLTTCSYFILYGLGRLWIEGLRMDSLYFMGLRVSQWLSLLLIIVFLAYAIYLIVQARKRNEPVFIFKQKAVAGISENQNAINEKFKNKINANALNIDTEKSENKIKANDDTEKSENKINANAVKSVNKSEGNVATNKKSANKTNGNTEKQNKANIKSKTRNKANNDTEKSATQNSVDKNLKKDTQSKIKKNKKDDK